MDSAIFLEWFRYAVNRVGSGYFGYAERVYCYELYHFLRVAMHHHERVNGPIGNIYLHSELVKAVISTDIAQRYEVWPLSAQRMPDFLFHTPGNFDNQVAAIEVKVSPTLSSADLIDDLKKLTELRQNYLYDLGIFHCVNIESDRLRMLLQRANAYDMVLDQDILVECKSSHGAPIESFKLSELLT